MLRGAGFILGVLLAATIVFALSDKGRKMIQPIMALAQSPLNEAGDPAIRRSPDSEEKDDETVVPNEALPESGEVKDKPDLPGRLEQPNPMETDQFITETKDTDFPQSVRQFKLWSPFHSKRAAQGFADRLANVADMSLDIKRTGPGRFQVMLLYRSEPERLASLERIERLTGLKIQ